MEKDEGGWMLGRDSGTRKTILIDSRDRELGMGGGSRTLTGIRRKRRRRMRECCRDDLGWGKGNTFGGRLG